MQHLRHRAVDTVTLACIYRGAEWNWSYWGTTYTSKRNSLTKESADKLIYVKSNMAVHTGTMLQLGD